MFLISTVGYEVSKWKYYILLYSIISYIFFKFLYFFFPFPWCRRVLVGYCATCASHQRRDHSAPKNIYCIPKCLNNRVNNLYTVHNAKNWDYMFVCHVWRNTYSTVYSILYTTQRIGITCLCGTCGETCIFSSDL